MRVNYRTNASVQFEVLTQDQRAEILDAALEVLAHTGVEVHNREALGILKSRGALVEGERVYIPGHLVRQALATAPSSFRVYSREGNPAKDIVIGPNRLHYGPGPTCPNIRDPRTGERRKYLRRDAATVARVCDALPHINFVESLGAISDVTPDLADVYEFADMMANTGKPIVAWSYTRETCQDIHRISFYSELGHGPQTVGWKVFIRRAQNHGISCPSTQIVSPPLKSTVPSTASPPKTWSSSGGNARPKDLSSRQRFRRQSPMRRYWSMHRTT